MTLRVVQWATGGVGTAAIKGILEHPGSRAGGLLGALGSQERQGTSVNSSVVSRSG